MYRFNMHKPNTKKTTTYKSMTYKSTAYKFNRHKHQIVRFFASFLLCLVCIPVNAATWNVEDYTLDQEDLLDGDIQTFEKDFSSGEKEGEKKGVMGVILIKAPYEKVWGVISDWEKQSDFVPGVEYFKVKHVFPGGDDKAWRSIVEGKLDIPFISLSYTLDTNFDKAEGTMVWNMLSQEDIKKYQAQKIDVNIADEDRLRNVEGFGKIKAYDEKSTVYYYAPIVETSVSLPGFVESAITNVSLSKYLHAIKERAEEK